MGPTTSAPDVALAARFVDDLSRRSGVTPVEAILYGSRARGEAHEQSDYDLLLVYENVTPPLREAVRRLWDEYLVRHGALFSVRMVSEDDMPAMRSEPYAINARREGIRLAGGPEPQTLVPEMMGKSRASLRLARTLLEQGEWDFAAGRAYYAAFHAMTAALASRGLTYSRHSGVSAFFRQQFVKTGIFDEAFSDYIRELITDREMAEYDYELSVSEARARSDVEAAAEIVEAVEAYLK